MRDLFKFEIGNWYPHMSKADRAIWERFILKYVDAYDSMQYDLHVGDPPPFNTLMDDDEDKNQDMLYRLRIDAVGYTDMEIHTIEIKPNAGPSTIGQVKSYKTLYERDEQPRLPVRAVIITDIERPNMAYLCKQEGVFLIVV